MKTIEQFSLRNIVLIERYLNDSMNPKEKREFLVRLSVDDELREDFDMVVDAFFQGEEQATEDENSFWFKIKQARQKSIVLSKADIARDIVGYGMFAVGVAGALVLICSVVVSVIS
ncbi:hypothetical protein V6R21_10340 [Limibacter armeniacum]|uniref:hypothetical protein n=1 Tax=Limibacter armeniacum TaxID=466084 RepID=UPI002FE5D72C